MLRRGFRPRQGARRARTTVVPIRDAAPALRARLEQKWRNCLNSSEKQGIEVLFSTRAEAFAELGRMLSDLQARKGFAVDLDAEFYAKVQAGTPEADRLLLGEARQSGALVAANLVAMHGDTAVYLLGATSEAGNKCKASYLLQWHTILRAKERDCKWYDLGGIDPEANPGVYRFKSGFGGVEAAFPGPYDRIASGLRGVVTRFVEGLYSGIKKMRGNRRR